MNLKARSLGTVLTLLVSVPPSSTAAERPDESLVLRGRYLMGTICEARAFGSEARTGAALDAALDRIEALEQVMTTWRPDGELARLNAACAASATSVRVSADLARALDGARHWAARTDGAFDPTIGALASAHGLRDGGRIPSEAEVARALSRTSWRLLEVSASQGTVRCLAPGVELDLGGYGKGFALDEAARVLRRHGVGAALLNFGGQVLALGAPPHEPGWVVAIAHPGDRLLAVAELTVRDASVATSSNAERGHVLDPRTGRSATWPVAVTVVAFDGAGADALSTALLIAGPERAPQLLPPGAQFVALEDVHGSVRVTAGTRTLQDQLTWRSGR